VRAIQFCTCVLGQLFESVQKEEKWGEKTEEFLKARIQEWLA